MKRIINLYDEKENKVKSVNQADFMEAIFYNDKDELETIDYYVSRKEEKNTITALALRALLKKQGMI